MTEAIGGAMVAHWPSDETPIHMSTNAWSSRWCVSSSATSASIWVSSPLTRFVTIPSPGLCRVLHVRRSFDLCSQVPAHVEPVHRSASFSGSDKPLHNDQEQTKPECSRGRRRGKNGRGCGVVESLQPPLGVKFANLDLRPPDHADSGRRDLHARRSDSCTSPGRRVLTGRCGRSIAFLERLAGRD